MPTSFLVVALLLCVLAALFVLLPALSNARRHGGTWWFSGGLGAALIIIGTAAFYSVTSDWNWRAYGVPESPFAQQLYDLQKAVHDNDNDPRAWSALGRFYLQFETQLPSAIDALERSVSLSQGRDVETNLNLVEALAVRGAPNDLERTAEILNASLSLDPSNRKALWYGGEVAASMGRWDVAMARWQVMLNDAKALDTEEARSVVALLEQRIETAVRERDGHSGVASTGGSNLASSDRGATNAPEALRVRVELSRDMAQTPALTPATNVFVFVRPKEQGGPPLAVHRATVGQLPLDVVLSDADAMMPTRTLSTFDHLEVVARVALGGKPTMTPGDLFGMRDVQAGEPRDIQITIDQIAQ